MDARDAASPLLMALQSASAEELAAAFLELDSKKRDDVLQRILQVHGRPQVRVVMAASGEVVPVDVTQAANVQEAKVLIAKVQKVDVEQLQALHGDVVLDGTEKLPDVLSIIVQAKKPKERQPCTHKNKSIWRNNYMHGYIEEYTCKDCGHRWEESFGD